MTKFVTSARHMIFLLIAIIFISKINYSCATAYRSLPMADLSNDEDDDDVQEERRMYDFNQLRRFLLTSNADQRAAKREHQEFLKRQLVREYLDAVSDSDSNRFQEIKKRFCASYAEFYATQAACLG